MTSPNSSLAAELTQQGSRISNLEAQRASYMAGTVSSIDLVASTFGADILRPDGTTTTVTGIGASPQFLPAVGNVVTLALSGAQIIYMPYGVAAGSIDVPQLAPAVTTTLTAVGTKITTYYAGTAPTTGLAVGDLWINTGSNNTLYRYSGSSWIQVQDQQIQSALTAAGTAQATADGKVQTFYRGTAPANPADSIGVGDLWINTASGNALYRWSGSAWVSVQDTAIQTALTNAANAQSTANTKVLIFAQATPPTAQEVGDMWFDTDNGNRMYIWGPTPTVTRINYALNPSFEADAVGTVTSVSSWTNFAAGSLGTVTRSIVTTGGVTSGTQAAKSVASSHSATAGACHGFNQTLAGFAQGDIVRIQATVQITGTTNANIIPQLVIEYLNAAGTVLGSLAAQGNGTITTNQLLSLTTPALPTNTVSVRVWVQRVAIATAGSAVTNASVTVDSYLVERNRDSAAPTTYFDGDTAANNDSVWGNPNAAPNSPSTIWQAGVSGVNAWQPQQLRSNALQPQSILGDNCIAYGSITAPLLEALLVLTGSLIAGDPNADHAALMADGLHLFRTIVGEGVQEVGTLAVSGFGSALAFVDSTGRQVAQIDESGNADIAGLNVDTDPLFMGTSFTRWLDSASNSGATNPYLNGQTTGGFANGTITGVTAETGLSEVPVFVDATRWYMLGYEASYLVTDPGCEARFRIRDGGTGTPTLGSPLIMYTQHSDTRLAGYATRAQKFGFWQPVTTGTHRLLLSVEGVNAGAVNIDVVNANSAIYCIDMGPRGPGLVTGQVNRGAGGTPPPVQNNYTERAPSGHWTYQGGGTLRTDTTDVVQGWDPSGTNGDGHGGWNFTIPNISGTVTRVDFYLYNNWSYYNSGGQALLRLVSSSNTSSPTVLQTTWNPGVTYPKPGPVTVTLPSSWFGSFNGRTSIGLYLGPAGNSNETFYIRADGPSARLRIWYTQ